MILRTITLSAILSLSLLANDVHKERVSDMKGMADGMALILNGLLYDYSDTAIEGATIIKKYAKQIKDKKDLKKYLPKDTAYAYKFGEKSLKRITEYSDEVIEAFKHKDYSAAQESANLLLRQCNSCHSRVRGW